MTCMRGRGLGSSARSVNPWVESVWAVPRRRASRHWCTSSRAARATPRRWACSHGGRSGDARMCRRRLASQRILLTWVVIDPRGGRWQEGALPMRRTVTPPTVREAAAQLEPRPAWESAWPRRGRASSRCGPDRLWTMASSCCVLEPGGRQDAVATGRVLAGQVIEDAP